VVVLTGGAHPNSVRYVPRQPPAASAIASSNVRAAELCVFGVGVVLQQSGVAVLAAKRGQRACMCAHHVVTSRCTQGGCTVLVV
jgi:hypothetical protein